eukprot:CAMPEP_0115367930 /NCGR_PEP_ID=MMETSP0270-20121206/105561_1 /TAXON_ID=71861 /ORGANISM="Scrippsiella trochoidea, Strain CCMP3099" /LENGTH=492 /DNA_ID=CAMNT_0002790721 /DNA_START=127 /DNA_END=1601 /DNA_ORIENTATION=+
MKFSALVKEVLRLEAKNPHLIAKKSQQADLAGLGMRSVCYSMCENRYFTNGMLAIIIVNSIILASDSYPPINSDLQGSFETINLMCSLLFIVEVTIKMFGLGINFFGDYFNLFDLFLALASLYEVFISGEAAMSALRIARLLRVFKIIGVNDSVRVLLRVLKQTVMPTSNFSFLVVLLVYVLALLGLQFFYESRTERDRPYFNFASLDWAIVSVFALLVGQDWHSMMVQTLRVQEDDTIVILFYLMSYILGHLILVNLFKAVFIVAFSRARDELLLEFRNRLYDLQYPDEQEEAAASPAAARYNADDTDVESEVDSPLWPEDASEHRLHFVWVEEEEEEEEQDAQCSEQVSFRPTIDGLDGTTDTLPLPPAGHHHHHHHGSSMMQRVGFGGDSKEEADGWNDAADEEGPQRPPSLTVPQSSHAACPPSGENIGAMLQADDEASPRLARAIDHRSHELCPPLRVAADGEGVHQKPALGVAFVPTAANMLQAPA